MKKIISIATALSVAVMIAGPVPAQALTAEELQAQINALLAQLSGLQTQLTQLQGTQPTGATPAACSGITFDRNLAQGTSGNDVKCLQALLNQDADTQVAASGAGSPGSETTYFGPLTKAAVIKFQEKNAAEILTPIGLTAGTGFVGPMTRTKLNAMLAGTVVPPGVVCGNGVCETGETSTNCLIDCPVIPVAAGLTVALAADTPVSATIASGANANFTKFSLTAGSEGEVAISKIYVTRGGLSANSDIENIKIIEADTGVYFGSIGSLNVDNRAMITFTQNLKIPAGTTKSFFIRAGFISTATAGKTATLGIAVATDITSNASAVNGTFPATGNAMSVVTLTLGSATVSEDGTTVDTKPDVGKTDVTINQFKVAAGSTEAITIEQITMLKAGTVSSSYISNLELYDVTGAKSLGTVASLNAEGKASWSNLNLVLGKGNTQRFRIMCDIVDGPGLTVNADIVDGSDVLMTVKGNNYGFYITPSAGAWGGQGTNPQTINSGSLTVSKSASTPATGNTSAGDSKTIAVFDFDARGEQMKISSLKVSFDLGAGDAPDEGEITNVAVYDENGTIVAGPQDLGTTDYTVNGNTYEGYVTFTDTFIVPVGIHKYTVKVKIASTVVTGDTIRAGIGDADSDITAKGMTSNSSVGAAPTASNVNGNTLTVAAGDLVVTTLDTPAGRSLAAGIQDFVWATASLSAVNSGEDVQVTALTISDNLGDINDDPATIDNAELWADLTAENSTRGDVFETKISNTEQPDDGNTDPETQAFTLTQTVTVPLGSFIRVALVADLAAGATAGDTHTFTISSATANGASTGGTIAPSYSGNGQTMQAAASGTLTISRDASSPVADIVLGGQTSTLAIFRLAETSNVENLDVDDITLTVTNGTVVDTYYFYSGDKLIGSVAGGTAPKIVLADGTLTIPAKGNVKVTVKAKYLPVDDAIVTNNTTVTAGIAATAVLNTTGLASGVPVTSGATEAAGYGMDLYKTKPTFSKNASSPSGTLVTGTTTLLAIFDVKADAAEDVTFENGDGNSLTVSISSTRNDSDGSAQDFVFKDEDGNILETVSVADSATTVQCAFVTTSLTVPANGTKKISIYGDTTDWEDGGDTIQLWLDDNTPGNVDWGVDGSGSYNDADKIFRGDIMAGALTNPKSF